MDSTLLLVDDEEKVLEFMKPYLEREGFTVYTAGSGKEALQLTEKYHPDLVVLDWMMPGMNGLDVCRQLREYPNIGIIMVTARGDETDKVIGLEVGADDYIPKPFSLRELTARIRSVLRRVQTIEPINKESKNLTIGDLTVDEEKFLVRKKDEEIILTPTEFQIFLTLASKPGVVYSRLQLLQAAIGEAYLNYERTIDSHISHLRKKIEDDPSNPKYIQTVHGIGYRLGDQR